MARPPRKQRSVPLLATACRALGLAASVVLATSVGWRLPTATAVPADAAPDVLVVGGTPGGVAAALGAARAGASVLLVEPDERLGGLLTNAWVTTFDMNLGPDGEHLTRGVFLEQYRKLGISFDRHQPAQVLGSAVAGERRLWTMLETQVVALSLAGGRIDAVDVEDRRWRRVVRIRPAHVIDATDDGDVAAAAAAPWVLGRPGRRPGERWTQAATLIFRLGPVAWDALAGDVIHRVRGGADRFVWGVNGQAAWGYPDVTAAYRPQDPRIVLYPLNLARQSDGSVLINALNITGVNGLDPASVAWGRITALRELPALAAYLREHVPGFGRAALLDVAPALYVRETRHIAGRYTLTVEDVLAGHVFDDRVAVASYPVDIHPYYPGWTNPFPRLAIEYTIPFRAIVPVRPGNLLLATGAFSATSEAYGSARVVPTVMSLGQAAGVAAALCSAARCAMPASAEEPAFVKRLQGALVAQGAFLGARRWAGRSGR